jgi:hypothetical protein
LEIWYNAINGYYPWVRKCPSENQVRFEGRPAQFNCSFQLDIKDDQGKNYTLWVKIKTIYFLCNLRMGTISYIAALSILV